MMAVVIPTNRPALSNNGPPELPGLTAALVWITPVIGRPLADSKVRPSA